MSLQPRLKNLRKKNLRKKNRLKNSSLMSRMRLTT